MNQWKTKSLLSIYPFIYLLHNLESVKPSNPPCWQLGQICNLTILQCCKRRFCIQEYELGSHLCELPHIQFAWRRLWPAHNGVSYLSFDFGPGRNHFSSIVCNIGWSFATCKQWFTFTFIMTNECAPTEKQILIARRQTKIYAYFYTHIWNEVDKNRLCDS